MDAAQHFQTGTLQRLRRFGLRLRGYVLLDGLAVVIPVTLALMLVTLAIDRTFRLQWDMRLTQLTTIGLALAGLTWWTTIRPVRLRFGDIDLASVVERRFHRLQSLFVSAVEFVTTRTPDRRPRRPDAMTNCVIARAERAVADIRFADCLNHRRARARLGIVLVCLAVAVTVTIATPETVGLWFERNVLLGEVSWPCRNQLRVTGLTDGRLMAARGDDITIYAVVEPGYEPPRQVYIRSTSPGRASQDDQMPAIRTETVQFTHTFKNIQQSIECVIYGGDAETRPFTIEVVDRPRVTHVQIKLTPPAYTGLGSMALRPGEKDVETLRGTTIGITAETNKPTRRARLIRQTGTVVEDLGPVEPLPDRQLAVSDRPDISASSVTYTFDLTDVHGLSNSSERAEPLAVSVRLVTDQPPEVQMNLTGVGMMVTPQAVLPITMEFTDAFGLASADLTYIATDEGGDSIPATQPVDRPALREPLEGLEPGTSSFMQDLGWSLAARNIPSGTRLTLQAEARDFNDVTGPGVSLSAPTSLRVVEPSEFLAELNRREREFRQDFERIIDRQKDLYWELLTLTRDKKGQSDERQKAFDRASRRQRDQAGRTEALRLQFERLLTEMRISQLATPEVEQRLGAGIITPLADLAQSRMPAAARLLDQLAEAETDDLLAEIASREAEILATMNAILARMLEWQRYQEAVTLLRDILEMQRKLNRETEDEIETRIFGNKPANGSPDR